MKAKFINEFMKAKFINENMNNIENIINDLFGITKSLMHAYFESHKNKKIQVNLSVEDLKELKLYLKFILKEII